MAIAISNSQDAAALSAARRHRAEALGATLPPLQVAAEQVAETVAQGTHGRRRVGLGETFWQYRSYEPDDPPNRIDWRRSARSDRVFVRETEWEAAQSVWLWRDTSSSMRYRSDRGLPTKLDRADLLTMAAMALLVRGGERIALLGRAESPAVGRTAFNRLCMTVATESLSDKEDGDSLPAAIPLPRHASVVLFGDFLSPPDEIEALVHGLGERGVRGHMLQILDPAETSMPFAGRSRFTGLEAKGDLLVGRAESLRDDYLTRLARHQDALRDLTRLTGWSFTVHHTDQPAEPALLALYGVLTDQPVF